MTEEKTLEEVLFDLLKRDFQIKFGRIQIIIDEPPILYVTPDAEELLNDRKIKIRWIDSDGKVEEQDGIQR